MNQNFCGHEADQGKGAQNSEAHLMEKKRLGP